MEFCLLEAKDKVFQGYFAGFAMRKVYLQSCLAFILLIILFFDVRLAAKKGSYSVPLLRTKRDLRDSRGNPTENLKGRPGQGYYIATDLGTPAQRVSDADFLEVVVVDEIDLLFNFSIIALKSLFDICRFSVRFFLNIRLFNHLKT